MSMVSVWAGTLWLAALLAPLALSAIWWQRRLVNFDDAPTRALAAIVAVVAGVVGLATLLGAIGALRAIPFTAASWVIAGVTWFARQRHPGAPAAPPPSARRVSWVEVVVAVSLVGPLAHAAMTLRRGMWDGDTLWYHGPFVAKVVQTGFIGSLHLVDASPLVSYFPANSELLAVVLALPFHTDVWWVALNVTWLAAAIVAGASLGARLGSVRIGVLATTSVAAGPVMTATQAGTGRNDLAALTLLVGAASLVLHGLDEAEPHRRRATLGLAGVAAGLGAGVKLSTFTIVGGLGLVVWLVSLARRRWGDLVVFSIATAAFGGSWFIRNAVRTGNPLPIFDADLGPLHLHSAIPSSESAGVSTALDALRLPNGFADVIVDGLRLSLGPLWPAIVGLVIVGTATLVWRGHGVEKLLGVAVGMAIVLHPLTPNSAPAVNTGLVSVVRTIFALNLRYVMPALVIALIGLARLPRFERVIVVVLGAATVAGQLPRDLPSITYEWRLDQRAWVLAFVAVAVGGIVWHLMPRWPRATFAVVGLLALVAAGPVGRHEIAHRHRSDEDVPPASAYALAQDLHHERVAVSGDFLQMPYLGNTWTNTVDYVNVRTPHGGARRARTCGEWRAAVHRLDPTIVVIAPPPFAADAPERSWLRGVAGANVLLDQHGVQVVRLDRPIDPSTCPGP